MNVGFISLGCSKNLIDTEATIGICKEHGLEIVNEEKDSDIIIINTCGFIDSAKEEAINTTVLLWTRRPTEEVPGEKFGS